MRLYLIQHGEAKTEEEDPSRPLTDKGKREVEKVARAVRRLGVNPLIIFYSGKLRAEQTAKIMANTLGTSKEPEATLGLKPNDDVKVWASKILGYRDDIMVIGHLPFMDRLSSLLLCGDDNIGIVQFRYGAIVCLEHGESGSWTLQWILTPEMARYR